MYTKLLTNYTSNKKSGLFNSALTSFLFTYAHLRSKAHSGVSVTLHILITTLAAVNNIYTIP